MGTQQSRSGHGRQGSHQPGQQSDHRPQQDRDLQRNKQSDRSQQQHQASARERQQQAGSANKREAHGTGTRREQAGSASEQEARSAGMRHQQMQGGAPSTSGQQEQQAERQQSQVGGRKDFTHRMENEGREQNREQQDVRGQQSRQEVRQQGQQNVRDRQGQQNVYGEGNYAASRQYDEATKKYVESGRVEPAARAAAPKSRGEAREMDAAEAEGKRHAKGEDPALNRRASPSSGESSETPRPGHEEE